MDNSFMGYVIGLAVGIVIGMPGSSEIVTKMNTDFRAAARAGTVTPEMHCRALGDFQDKLNEAYADRHKGKSPAPRFAFTPDDCVKAVRPPQP